MRVLVTGATGFLGGVLARRLAAAGVEVVGTGRDREKGAALERDGVRFVAADLAEGELRPLVRRCAHVHHCAARAADAGDAAAFERDNVRATRRLLEACRAEGVGRFVFVSTPSVFASTEDRLGIREGDPMPRPINAYAASKRAGEELVREAVSRGLQTVILRPQGLIGAGDPAIFPRLLEANARTGLPLLRGGRAWVDLTCVENVAEACVRAAEAGERAVGRTYHVTNGDPRTVRTLVRQLTEAVGTSPRWRPMPLPVALALGGVAERVARLRGTTPRLSRYAVTVLGVSRTLCIDAAREDLGYRPGPSLDEGIARFARAWLATRPAPPSLEVAHAR